MADRLLDRLALAAALAAALALAGGCNRGSTDLPESTDSPEGAPRQDFGESERVVLPAGLDFEVELAATLDAAEAAWESRLRGRVSQGLRIDRLLVVPAGSEVLGRASRPGPGRPIVVEWTKVVLPSGERLEVEGRLESRPPASGEGARLDAGAVSMVRVRGAQSVPTLP